VSDKRLLVKKETMTKNRPRRTNSEVVDEIDSPAEAPQSPNEPDIFARMANLTAEDWQNGHKVYVYRVWPVIDRKHSEHFIAKVAEPIDEDYLMRYYGSGKYFVRLNNRQGETIASKNVSLHNPSFPPKVSPDEVVATDPRNETYFKVWAPKETQAQPTANQATAPGDNATALRELTRLIDKLIEKRDAAPPEPRSDTKDKLVDWALKQKDKETEANDPTRVATLLRELKELVTPAPQPPPPPAADPLASLDRAADLLKKLQPAPAPVADPLAQIKQTAELVATLKQTFGQDGTAQESKMSGWQEFLKEPLTEFVGILKPFGGVLAHLAMTKIQENQPAGRISPHQRPCNREPAINRPQMSRRIRPPPAPRHQSS
jgi:hypothetical protein